MKKFHRCNFKCECMLYSGQRVTGFDVMSGTWKHHISLTNLTQPYGLHRIFYQLLPDSKEEFIHGNESFESCFKKIVYRKNRWIRSMG